MPQRKVKGQEVIDFIVATLSERQETRGLTKKIIEHFHLSRPAALAYVHQAEKKGIIRIEGERKAASYSLLSREMAPLLAKLTAVDGALENHYKILKIPLAEAAEKGEDRIYDDFVVPQLIAWNVKLPENLRNILRHGFTEIMNNAIDHSQGTCVTALVAVSLTTIFMAVIDDGIGALQNLADSFSLSTPMEAVGELLKGKRTSMPSRHAGEGIFFTSKIFDHFRLASNGLAYVFDNVVKDWTMEPVPLSTGTAVSMDVARNSTRQIHEVFAEYAPPEDDYQFLRSGPFSVKPYAIAVGENMVSRSEAKRLLAGAEKFRHITIDFKGTKSVGQAFVDEVFRVFPLQFPGIHIEPVNMNETVAFMVKRGWPKH